MNASYFLAKREMLSIKRVRVAMDTVGEVEKEQTWDNFTYLVIVPNIA